MKRRSMIAILFCASPLLPLSNAHTADPPKPPATVTVTVDDARAALAADATTRQQACQKAVGEACQKYGFTLQARVTIVGDRVQSEILLVPSS